MELISSLKPLKLKSFISPHNQALPSVPLITTPIDSQLRSSAFRGFHILEKQSDYAHQLIYEFIERMVSRNDGNSPNGLIILFDISYSWNCRNQYFNKLKKSLVASQLSSIIIIKDVQSLTDLIIRLKKLKDGSYELPASLSGSHIDTGNHFETTLSMIVIDGISNFLWLSKSTNSYPMEFLSCASVIRSLEDYFGCYSIVTSYDRSFDMGLTRAMRSVQHKLPRSAGSHKQADRNYLFEVSTIPTEFFKDRLVYCLNSRSRPSGLLNGKLVDTLHHSVYDIRNGGLSDLV